MSTTHDFTNKSALVTGGATGIGKGCAKFLLGTGAHVTIAGPDSAALDAAIAELEEARAEGARLEAVLCDVTDEEQVRGAVDAAAADGEPRHRRFKRGHRLPGPHPLARRRRLAASVSRKRDGHGLLHQTRGAGDARPRRRHDHRHLDD